MQIFQIVNAGAANANRWTQTGHSWKKRGRAWLTEIRRSTRLRKQFYHGNIETGQVRIASEALLNIDQAGRGVETVNGDRFEIRVEHRYHRDVGFQAETNLLRDFLLHVRQNKEGKTKGQQNKRKQRDRAFSRVVSLYLA